MKQPCIEIGDLVQIGEISCIWVKGEAKTGNMWVKGDAKTAYR